MADTKRCCKCAVTKALSEFHARPSSRDGYRHDCRECRRASAKRQYYADRPRQIANAKRYTMMRRYGLTPETWAAMLISQSGRCGVCEQPMCRKREPHVDHDHVTDKVRGMLCTVCNTAIGALGDNEAGVRRALAYLEAAR